MRIRLTFVAVCLLTGATASSAAGQSITLNRDLAFGSVGPTGSISVPGTYPADARAAWLTLTLGAGRNNCRGTILVSVQSTITRTTSPASTVTTSPFVATLVNPDGTTANVPIGTSTQFKFSGNHQLYVGTTGDFTAARVGGYSGSFTVSLTKGAGC